MAVLMSLIETAHPGVFPGGAGRSRIVKNFRSDKVASTSFHLLLLFSRAPARHR